MDYPAIGSAYTDTAEKRARLDAVIAKLEWLPTAETQTLPMSPGLAIKAVIKEFRIPKVSAVAHNGVLGNYGVLGIEGNYQNGRVRIYFLDRGSDVIPVAGDPQEETATV